MRTPLCDLLGIEHPIVQAAMGGPAVPSLVAAVSNAGALGMLVVMRADDVGAAVRETRRLTERPFGAHFGLRLDQHVRLDPAPGAGPRTRGRFSRRLAPTTA